MKKQRLLPLAEVDGLLKTIGSEASQPLQQLSNAEHSLANRSALKAYFDIYMQPQHYMGSSEISDAQLQIYFDQFTKHFMQDDLATDHDSYAAHVAQKNKWVYPVGFDITTGLIRRPLTHLFRKAATLCIDFQYFQDQMRANLKSLDPTTQALVQYADAKFKEASSPYEPLFNTMIQVSDNAIKFRADFESHFNNPMTREDWILWGPRLRKLILEQSAMSTMEAALFWDRMNLPESVFSFSDKSLESMPKSMAKLVPNPKEENLKAAFASYREEDKLRAYTGCPALFSRFTSGENLLDLTIQQYLNAIEKDFWPVVTRAEAPKKIIAQNCPYHHSS